MVMLYPVFRASLFFWICPKIGILNINKQFHAIFCCTSSNFSSSVQIAVSATVAISSTVIRLIPDTHSNIIDTMLRKCPKNILFPAIFITICDTCILHSQYRGYIDAPYRFTIIYIHIKLTEINSIIFSRYKRELCEIHREQSCHNR